MLRYLEMVEGAKTWGEVWAIADEARSLGEALPTDCDGVSYGEVMGRKPVKAWTTSQLLDRLSDVEDILRSQNESHETNIEYVDEMIEILAVMRQRSRARMAA